MSDTNIYNSVCMHRQGNSVEQPTTNRGYDIGFVFPPEGWAEVRAPHVKIDSVCSGMTCRGYDNATVSVRFPDGAGFDLCFAHVASSIIKRRCGCVW